MGRGRAKAKQTKVARALKYGGPDTDFERLAQELHASKPTSAYVPVQDDEEEEDLADIYAKYLDEDEEEESQDQT